LVDNHEHKDVPRHTVDGEPVVYLVGKSIAATRYPISTAHKYAKKRHNRPHYNLPFGSLVAQWEALKVVAHKQKAEVAVENAECCLPMRLGIDVELRVVA
jgi:hypothetical protein